MAFGDVDLPALFADLGVTVVYGANNTLGLYNQGTVILPELSGLGVDVLKTSVIIRTGSLGAPAITRGSTIVVDGISFTIHDVTIREDGKITVIELA